MTANFRVTYAMQNPQYWEVTDGSRSWSVAFTPKEGNPICYLIINSQGRVLKQDGGTGKRILRAVVDYVRWGA